MWWERFLLSNIRRSKPTIAGLVWTTQRHRLWTVAGTRAEPTVAKRERNIARNGGEPTVARRERTIARPKGIKPASAGPKGTIEGYLLRGAITGSKPFIARRKGIIKRHRLSQRNPVHHLSLQEVTL